METLKKIAHHLGLSDTFIKIVSGEVETPDTKSYYENLSVFWYQHPPCFIPLFVGYGASYKGLVHHFFCGRKTTFAEYILELGYFYEIARNEKQLITLMILAMISIEDEITDEIRKFCKEINYSDDDLNEVYDYYEEYGDDLKHVEELGYFVDELPFKYIENIDDYNGDFPSSIYTINKTQIKNACQFEFSSIDRLIELGMNIDSIPDWLKDNTNKKALFKQYLVENKLKEAWFTLNSKDWYLKDVAEALELFKQKTNDTLFHLVADNWIERWKEAMKNNQTNDIEMY